MLPDRYSGEILHELETWWSLPAVRPPHERRYRSPWWPSPATLWVVAGVLAAVGFSLVGLTGVAGTAAAFALAAAGWRCRSTRPGEPRPGRLFRRP